MNNVAPITSETKTEGKSHKGTGKRVDISMSENFALMKLMEVEYTSSGFNDVDFAEYAMTKIKMRPGVTIKSHNVGQRRQEMGIPSNTRVAKAADPSALAAMVIAQELRINALEEKLNLIDGWINSTFPTKGVKKAI
jgi:hypothetical protein